MSNKQTLAQFFTPPELAARMANLLQNRGTLLEPCCGDGALLRVLTADFDYKVAVELDPTKYRKAEPYCDFLLEADFFEYGLQKFNSIIANPPYLAAKAIPESTRSLPAFKKLEAVLGGHANLYSYFIAKCFMHLEDGGEMVFVVPDDVFMVTGNAKLLTLLHNSGTLTHVVKFKKSPFLPEVSQNAVVFRYVKGDMSHLTDIEIV